MSTRIHREAMRPLRTGVSALLCVLSVLCVLLLLSPSALAEEKPAPRTPDRTELWVPSDELARVLEKNKNAVLLTPEQYDALVRDAGKLKPAEASTPPPTDAVVESIRLKGRVLDGESGVRLSGEITAKALAKEWSLASVKLPWKSVGKLSTSDGALLTLPSDSKNTKALAAASALSLFVKGPAQHRVEFECAAAINHGGSPDERVLFYDRTAVPTVLELTLPAGAQITQGPSHETAGDVHRFMLNSGSSGTSIIAWRLQPPNGSLARVSTQSLRGVCRVAESEVTATYDLLLSSTATDAPAKEIAFDVSPASASVIAVEGDQVESWVQTGSALVVKLNGEARAPQLRVELRTPLVLPEKDTLPVELPALVLAGAKQVPAIVEMRFDEGVEMLELRSSRSLAASVAEWDAAAGKATAIIRKVSPRIVVDADARIFLSRDFAEIERIVNATTDVPVDHLAVTLPAEEQLLEVNWQSGPKLEWKRVGQTVEIDWQSRVDAHTLGKFTIKSRKKLPAAAQTITVTNITIDDAKKLAGYIALDHDAGWRIALKQTSGLEDRDARLTPVSGKMAWFALREFTLGFELQRRESVVDAEVTAYALPRAKSVEIEGQVALDITGAPLRQIEVRVTKEDAKLLRFTSPLIAEQSLDEVTGTWKLALARESTGRVNLRFRMSRTVALSLRERSEQSPNAPNSNAQDTAPTQLVSRSETATLTATLPRFEIPAARRFHGSWVVEANTDTQLSFTTKSLQPVDVMRVPAVEDYTPRHRLVAAFAYGTGTHELTVTATRHTSSELAALVVSKLALTSVLSVDGSSKHEAVIDLRHSGEQFAHVRLPPGAQLLSVLVDGRAVKPVRGENKDSAQGTERATNIAIPLPGGAVAGDTVSARLIYELPGDPWAAHGTRKLEPLTILGNAPILSTDWQVHVPDGYSYDKVATGLEQSGTFAPEGIFSKLVACLEPSPNFADARRSASPIPTDELRLPESPTAQKKRSVEPIVDREITQRMGGLEDARHDLDRGDKYWAESRYEDALSSFKAAMDSLSLSPNTLELRTLAEAKFSDAAVGLAREKAKEGRYDESVKLIDRALAVRPQHRGAATLKKQLQDPDRLPRFLSPEPSGRGLEKTSEYFDASRQQALKDKLDRIILPQVSLSGASVEEAIEFLRMKGRDLDVADKDSGNRLPTIVIANGDVPNNAQITLDLKDVPLSEALRYVTELAGMKYKIEPNAVVVVPITDPTSEMFTRIYTVQPDFAELDRDRVAGKVVNAGEKLKSFGIPFPEGAIATFDPTNSRLVVRNTQPNLDLIESFIQTIQSSKTPQSSKAGLVPLELDLPTFGQLLHFSGTQAPEVLELRFTSWERQMAWACGLMALGGLVFALWGRRRAVLRTLLVVLVLSLGVKLLAEERLPLANAALFGWLSALVLWFVFRVCVGISKRTGGVSHVEA